MADPQDRSVDFLVRNIRENPALEAQIKTDPVQALSTLAEQVKRDNPLTPQDDKFTFRFAVIVLGVVILVVVALIGIKYFNATSSDIKVPEILVAIGSTALGALAG